MYKLPVIQASRIALELRQGRVGSPTDVEGLQEATRLSPAGRNSDFNSINPHILPQGGWHP